MLPTLRHINFASNFSGQFFESLLLVRTKTVKLTFLATFQNRRHFKKQVICLMDLTLLNYLRILHSNVTLTKGNFNSQKEQINHCNVKYLIKTQSSKFLKSPNYVLFHEMFITHLIKAPTFSTCFDFPPSQLA